MIVRRVLMPGELRGLRVLPPIAKTLRPKRTPPGARTMTIATPTRISTGERDPVGMIRPPAGAVMLWSVAYCAASASGRGSCGDSRTDHEHDARDHQGDLRRTPGRTAKRICGGADGWRAATRRWPRSRRARTPSCRPRPAEPVGPPHRASLNVESIGADGLAGLHLEDQARRRAGRQRGTMKAGTLRRR